MTVVRVPTTGDEDVEPEVLAIYVAVGQRVQEGEPIAEISFDKVDVEVAAPHEGVVTAVYVAVGDVVALGADIAAIER